MQPKMNMLNVGKLVSYLTEYDELFLIYQHLIT